MTISSHNSVLTSDSQSYGAIIYLELCTWLASLKKLPQRTNVTWMTWTIIGRTCSIGRKNSLAAYDASVIIIIEACQELTVKNHHHQEVWKTSVAVLHVSTLQQCLARVWFCERLISVVSQRWTARCAKSKAKQFVGNSLYFLSNIRISLLFIGAFTARWSWKFTRGWWGLRATSKNFFNDWKNCDFQSCAKLGFRNGLSKLQLGFNANIFRVLSLFVLFENEKTFIELYKKHQLSIRIQPIVPNIFPNWWSF